MKSTWALLRDGFDRVTIYLPIILTAVLALGTYWLVRNAPRLIAPTAKVAPVHEPDYFMRGFVIKNYLANGDLRSELFGTEGRHFPDTDTLEVDKVRLRSISPTGFTTRATANRGLSNADGSEVQLFGDAIVTREPGSAAGGQPVPEMQFRGEFLYAFLDTERVTSNQPVTLTRGADKFTADNLDYDNMTGVAVLRGRVRGVLMPGANPAPAAAKKR
jgi:lipopolysaccharide export system protein LptC